MLHITALPFTVSVDKYDVNVTGTFFNVRLPGRQDHGDLTPERESRHIDQRRFFHAAAYVAETETKICFGHGKRR